MREIKRDRESGKERERGSYQDQHWPPESCRVWSLVGTSLSMPSRAVPSVFGERPEDRPALKYRTDKSHTHTHTHTHTQPYTHTPTHRAKHTYTHTHAHTHTHTHK